MYFFSSSDYITPEWQRQALVVGCVPFAERHNSESIANWIVKVIPCITMLVRSLERTGGAEEEGVRLFKDELKQTVLKRDSNRFGDIITNDFYLVSTLCDPR